MARPVVITRPRQQAEGLVQRLQALGLEAISYPLLEIHPLPDEAPLASTLARLSAYAMVAFVSPNAIAAALRHVQSWPAGVAIAVVGEGSRRALAAHGITEAQARIYCPGDPERSDSETLLRELDLPALAGRRVLIVRGESGRELLFDRLREAGVLVEQVAAYRRVAPVLDAAGAAALHALLARDATWIITSSEGLRNLLDLAGRTGHPADAARVRELALLVPHIRIEQSARELGFSRVQRCASGDEALIAKLQFS